MPIPLKNWIAKPMADRDDDLDAELILRVRKADQAAFERLYKRYYPKLFRFAYRITRRLDALEEIINDVMFVVWNKAETYQPEARPSTWIFGIAYNKCLKSLSSRSTAEHLELEEALDLLPAVKDKGLENLEVENWVAAAFSKLPPDQRAVLELTYHHGLQYQEIASIMDCPENTVKTRMFHARKKIKALFPELMNDSAADFQGASL